MDLNEYTDNVYEKIVTRIRQERDNQNITQKKIAEDLGLNPVTYSDMESGKTKFPVVRLLAVLKYLAITDIFEPEKPPINSSTQDLIVMDNFETFIQQFSQQTNEIAQLRQENIEIKALLNEILNRLAKNS
jgi:transcriptional regulator with XRE-family HTH domain